MHDHDLLIIGAGSAGVRCARASASLGARVAIVEAGRTGGTCVNVGCVPKKLMVYASHFAEEMQLARGYGWSVGAHVHDWAGFIAAKDAEITRLNGVYERLLRGAGATLLRGRAQITGPHSIEIGGDRHTARHIVIATGARPMRPTTPGVEHAIVSDDVFALAQRPPRVVVVGGGYIAVEFAGVFRGLGSEVTLVHRGAHVLRGFDDDARAFLTDEMRKKGVCLRLNATVEFIEKLPSGLLCELPETEEIEADAVLYAIGRVPNTEGLGLAEVGVEIDADGAVVVDEYSHTRVPSIHAIGDVTNRMNLTPIALAEGAALAKTLFGGAPTEVNYNNVPTAVFAQPPLSSVGLTESQAHAVCAKVDVYTSEFRPLKHTLSGSQERTFMKLVVDAETDRVLGVHVVGIDAPEIVQGLAIALVCGATKAQFDATIGIHPTVAEEIVALRVKRAMPAVDDPKITTR
jgi:glutathione reductase (NADPH)